MKKYVCTVCNWVYDPLVGDPDSGIAPNTSFEDIPEELEDEDDYNEFVDTFIRIIQKPGYRY